MKIGIISIHSAHNFGSVLQAYALQEKIKEYKTEVEIINYRPNYIEREYKIFSKGYYKKHGGMIKKFFRFIFRVLTINSRIKRYKKFEKFIKENMNTTKVFNSFQELNDYKFDFDITICGSDQIWNTKITEGLDRAYFLDFIDNGCKKVAYAPSLGKNEIDPQYEKLFEKYINNFEYISLREKANVNLVKEYTEKRIESVLDPTMLLPKNKWNDLIIKSNIKLPDKYILVYMLEYNEEIIKIIKKITKNLNLPIFSINKRKYFYKEKLYSNIGPEDFLKLMKNAELIITNSFHGTAFSIIFEKNVCIVPNLNSGLRLIDLANKLGLEKRVIANVEELNLHKIVKKIDYKKVNLELEKERKISEKFLNDVICYEK